MPHSSPRDIEEKLSSYQRFLVFLRYVIAAHFALGAFAALWWVAKTELWVALVAGLIVLLLGIRLAGGLRAWRRRRPANAELADIVPPSE